MKQYKLKIQQLSKENDALKKENACLKNKMEEKEEVAKIIYLD